DRLPADSRHQTVNSLPLGLARTPPSPVVLRRLGEAHFLSGSRNTTVEDPCCEFGRKPLSNLLVRRLCRDLNASTADRSSDEEEPVSLPLAWGDELERHGLSASTSWA